MQPGGLRKAARPHVRCRDDLGKDARTPEMRIWWAKAMNR
jgi:hypothetical protein